LIWKSPWSPIQILTRASHETLNVYHQLLGRIITFLVVLHAILYLNFYVQSNLLGSKLKEFYVICGLVSVIAFIAIGTTALAPIRRWSYRVFYVVHVALATALIPGLFFHVHHIRIYLYETAAIYVLNTLVRWLSTSDLRASIRLIPKTSLVEIKVPVDSSDASKRLVQDIRPGQHAYVSLSGTSLLHAFRSNPFTVASVPSTDRHIKFVARALKGNTKTLLLSAEKDTSNAKLNITMEGSYGVSTHEDRLMQYDRVLFIAGGVGATFIAPLYRQLLADLSPGKGSYRRQKISFVWIARSKSEVTWAVPNDQREREGFAERLKVCLTGVSTEGNENATDYDERPETIAVRENDDAIELEEQKQLLSDIAQSDNNGSAGLSDLPTYTGRPDLRRLVQQTLSHGSNERVAIVVCGPKKLSHDLRREIAPWIKRGREVWFHDESFSL
jgi:ferredoxin-NADP reductase